MGVKILYEVNSCPQCGKELFKTVAGEIVVGSPLLKCKHCKQTYVTNSKCEWYKFEHKAGYIWAVPFLIAVIVVLLAVAFFIGPIYFDEDDVVVAILVGIFIIFVSLILWVKSLCRILMSKRRMKRKSYLEELLSAGVIDQTEFLVLFENAKDSFSKSK